jgi:hypothetical protein
MEIDNIKLFQKKQSRKYRLLWYNILNQKINELSYTKCNLNLDSKIFEIEKLLSSEEQGITPSLTVFGKLKKNGFIIDEINDDLNIVPNDFVMKISFTPNEFKDEIKNKLNNYIFNHRKQDIVGLYSAFEKSDDIYIQKFYNQNIKNKKVFYFPKYVKNTTLLYEIYLYENIINQLFIYNFTPNIFLYLTSFECPNFYNSLDNSDSESNSTKIKEKINELNESFAYKDEYYPNKEQFNFFGTANLLLMERGKGETLKSWLNNNPINNKNNFDNFRKLILQSLFTHEVFNMIGLKHNDNHLDNYYVENLNEKMHLVYFYKENEWFQFSTEFLIKIFDFDQSSLTGKSIFSSLSKINNYLDIFNGACMSSNRCNNEDYDYKDIYRFFCRIIKKFQEDNQYENPNIYIKNILQFIYKYIPSDFFTKYGNSGYCEFCKFKENLVYSEDSGENQFNIKVCERITDLDKLKIIDILYDKFFDDLRENNYYNFPKNLILNSSQKMLREKNIYFLPNINQNRTLNKFISK